MSLNPATFALNPQGIDALRAQASRDPQTATKEAAKQFEALFMNEVMKRMRAATMESGLLENRLTQVGTEMLDQQFATQMSGLPGGLSAAIERQLSRNLPSAAPPAPAGALSGLVKETQNLPDLAKKNVPTHAARFIQQHGDAARAVAQESGLPADFMLAQAAHETGWGRARMRATDGTPANNLFGIKAGPGWKGKVAEVTTTEYINGEARKVVAKFRAYDSPQESFRDYARLLTGNQRYAQAVASAQAAPDNAAAFAKHLQRAGYATDPDYANKLARVINTTVRVQRALA
ncbi:flagellar assembly peptidoglycan hydrolase FlgJ [Inhella gelatinilytica]|uniref:Peptidoglycan hydrolase FlgJ n=1 Tax=Inhella gelatinilytica TaxID=2795030 RepID=A0A931NDX1_9BURK|nr:flagellar assembly peptidoglycan hydrolase FlgJ [Inhella gelatinilytica]MBH9553547.1 flagellar assembly peptidoglycan hydrolase FlgJ [Inhella gelatinilytica]